MGKILDDIIKQNQQKQNRAQGGKSASCEEENLVQVLLRIQKSENLDVPITNDNIKAVIWFRVAFGDNHKDNQERLLQLLPAALERLDGFNLVDLFPSMKFVLFITEWKHSW
ncbi:hypothetical protein K1719_005096 [Acacia pycnantha]|nr:hypothetical protein K1719_005096 [Acacia pycnantha]